MFKKLQLTKLESEILRRFGNVEVVRNDFVLRIEPNPLYDDSEVETFYNNRYNVEVINDYYTAILK